MARRKRYLVITPEFEYTDIICDGMGPRYTECDAVEIEAKNARDAVTLGVKVMLDGGRRFTYCRSQRIDGCSPYTGVRAIIPERG